MNSQIEFQKILQSLQRPINCLADEDRNIRKSGLDAIKKQMNTISKENVLKLFNQTKLTAMLTKIINDKIQNNRQLSLEIIEQLIKIVGGEGKNLYEQVLPSLISRINQTPFPQKSEDLRLRIVNIFIKLIAYKDCLLKNLPQLASAVAKCLADAYDQIKNTACELTNKLSQALPHQIGKHSSNILLSLRDNLKHQKFKVRRTSLQTIGYILIADGAGGNFQHVKVAMKATLSDKKKQVRDSAYDSIGHLLLYLGPKYMKEYQATLTGLLLMGLDDESPETVERVIGILQKCGGKLREQQGEQTEMIGQNSK